MALSRLLQAPSRASTRLSRSGLVGEFIGFCKLLQYWDVGQSRNRVKIHSSTDGRATKSVRSTWYVRHRCWACARRNDLGRALYVTVALAFGMA
jgi:hypothetical protein